MKNRKVITIVIAIAMALVAASCERKCRCYHYNGSIVEFSQDELDGMGENCVTIEEINFGLTYSLCEWVL